jgi:MFS superfamily sulfate permease-like transporter
VIYDFSHSGYIDPSAAMAIDEMIDQSVRHGRYVIVSGLRDQAFATLDGMGVLDRIPGEQRFEQRRDSIAAAVDVCRQRMSQADASSGAA